MTVEEFLADLDDVVDNWYGSKDAMRWTPELAREAELSQFEEWYQTLVTYGEAWITIDTIPDQTYREVTSFRWNAAWAEWRRHAVSRGGLWRSGPVRRGEVHEDGSVRGGG